MASNVNPNNIDTTYPIAGQDNDSQGFRDNFTNIKTNFSYTERELSDLQNKVLLKLGLEGGDPADIHNNLNGTKLTGALMQDIRQEISTSIPQGSAMIDTANGGYQTIIISAVQPNIALDFAFPAASYSTVRVDITNTVGTLNCNFPKPLTGENKLAQWTGVGTLTLPIGRYIYDFFSIDAGNEIIVTPILESVT